MYNLSFLKADALAGITVGVMLIPQGMAYAMIAGLPPIYGLYASTVPLLIYALLGTSRQLAVGPVAMVSLLVATGISDLVNPESTEYLSLAILLALMVGAIQFFLGAVRMGFLVNFLSHPVISGFTSAAALIIGLSQLKYLLGISLSGGKHVHLLLMEAAKRIGETHLLSLTIGLAGIALILLVRKMHKSFPGPILVVGLSIAAVYLFQLDNRGVDIVGAIPQGLPSFTMPNLDTQVLATLFPMALAISLVSFMESIAVAKAVQSRHKNYKVDANQELMALGAANIFGSFFQSYPVTGGFSRTAVNEQSGARTNMAGVFSALLIVLTLLFLTPLFYNLPKAVLASVIMVAVYGLIDFDQARYLWKTDKMDFYMLLVTFVTTLALGIEEGIIAGVILSLVLLIYRTTHPHFAILGRVPGTDIFRNFERFSEIEPDQKTMIFRFDARLYFANIDYFRSIIDNYVDDHPDTLENLILSFESINSVDSSALHMLSDLIRDYTAKKYRVIFTEVKGPVRDKFLVSGITDQLGADNFFMSISKAVDTL